MTRAPAARLLCSSCAVASARTVPGVASRRTASTIASTSSVSVSSTSSSSSSSGGGDGGGISASAAGRQCGSAAASSSASSACALDAVPGLVGATHSVRSLARLQCPMAAAGNAGARRTLATAAAAASSSATDSPALGSTMPAYPEAFVAGDAAADSPVGSGRGVIVEDAATVRGSSGASPSDLQDDSKRHARVQSFLLASSQYLPLPTSVAHSGSNAPEPLHNASLANLGNSLLGLFALEHLHLRYPQIPTRVLKAALAAYVGPSTAADVAMELGLQGSIIRWDESRVEVLPDLKINPARPRTEAGPIAMLEDAAARMRKRSQDLAVERMTRRRKGFVGAEGELKGEDDGSALRKKDIFASAVRALVAVIYQELGMSVARHFVSSHFLTRVVALPAFLKFNDPKRVLSSTLEKYGLPRPQSRLVAETGRLSINPVFVVGIWSDANKIGEGSGTSLRMAEYRAAEDALRRLYLAESDPSGFQVPSLTIEAPGQPGAAQLDTVSFVSQPLGRSEVVHGSRA
ncbi:54S ribosomal protein L3 mitochondrial [Tilletia horrida]|uniref:Large ribosomal subunit protein mL44 n=1 Tax=Tilletia horrida TaxID=155126 RepID=A0AAN6JL88_9BASI|nr:54S ribosomal protein L3 mitochondrial [Tilletia horrida]